MRKNIIILGVVLFSMIFSTLHGEFYYRPDSTQIQIDVFDNLVAVGFGGFIEPEADMFAQTRAYLRDDFEFENIPGDMIVFGIEPGYSLEYAMDQLRAEPNVYLVNPVVISTDSTPIYVSNQIVAYFIIIYQSRKLTH